MFAKCPLQSVPLHIIWGKNKKQVWKCISTAVDTGAEENAWDALWWRVLPYMHDFATKYRPHHRAGQGDQDSRLLAIERAYGGTVATVRTFLRKPNPIVRVDQVRQTPNTNLR